MLPVDVAAYITMHMELPEYSTYDKLFKFVKKYVKVLQNLKERVVLVHFDEPAALPSLRSAAIPASSMPFKQSVPISTD